MQDKVLLAHGGGGRLMSELIEDMIRPRLANPHLDRMDDSAVLPGEGGRLAFTSDSFVVRPWRFPGGNIGDLAVVGTVNDLSMSGAVPRYLSLSLILEEGLAFADLELVLDSVRARADETGVQVVCGDTKVVERGRADGLYINTAGIGVLPEGVELGSACARPGDRVLLSGVVGLHGLAVMLARGEIALDTPLVSDVAPLNALVAAWLEAGVELRALRDLTRGGLAAALDDIAARSAASIELDEARFPVSAAQQSACELLGLDPLHIACEGRLAAIVASEHADRALELARGFEVASEAELVGEVREQGRYPLELITAIGTRRVVQVPAGDQMPRIC